MPWAMKGHGVQQLSDEWFPESRPVLRDFVRATRLVPSGTSYHALRAKRRSRPSGLLSAVPLLRRLQPLSYQSRIQTLVDLTGESINIEIKCGFPACSLLRVRHHFLHSFLQPACARFWRAVTKDP